MLIWLCLTIYFLASQNCNKNTVSDKNNNSDNNKLDNDQNFNNDNDLGPHAHDDATANKTIVKDSKVFMKKGHNSIYNYQNCNFTDKVLRDEIVELRVEFLKYSKLTHGLI